MERYYYTSVSKKLKSLKVAKSKDLDVDFVEVGGEWWDWCCGWLLWMVVEMVINVDGCANGNVDGNV